MEVRKKDRINARQVKAARALLDWSQEDLASKAGLSIATVQKFESGNLSPRDKTICAMVHVLEQADIEFLGTGGVRINTYDVSTIDNGNCYLKLLEKIYHETEQGNEILFLNGDSSRMDETEWNALLRLKEKGITFRALTYEGENNLLVPPEAYRWLPARYYEYNLITIYQDKVAISLYKNSTETNMDQILLIKNRSLANSLRNSFEFMWENCRKSSRSVFEEKKSDKSKRRK